MGAFKHIIVKIIVNNNEYSFQSFGTSGVGDDGISVVDFLNLPEASSTVDFTIKNASSNNNITLLSNAGLDGGQSYRSLIMIERVR